MNLINQYKNKKVSKKTKDLSRDLILSNNLGNFLYLTGKEEESRYQGFFHINNKNINRRPEIYKIIDSIIFSQDQGDINEISNHFFKAERKYKNGLIETYFIPEDSNSLCVTLNKNTEVEIVLDVRSPYDSRSMGRFYSMKKEDDCLVIKFVKRRDWQEDHLGDKKEFSIFLVIKSNNDSYENIEEFFSKYYPKDQDRNSFPWNRFVFKAFKMKFKKAVFSVSKTKKEALAEANKSFKDLEKLYKKTRDEYGNFNIPKITDPEIKMANLCAQSSLKSLLVEKENTGAYAGIPWFFQFWHRDEAVALPQIYKINKKIAGDIIISQLDSIIKSGLFLKRRFPDETEEESADYLGFLARSCQQIFKENRIKKDFRNEVVKKFEKTVPMLLQKRTSEDLATNFSKETWMDSLDRAGERIEIQAGRLAIYKFLLSETDNGQYKILLEDLERKTIEKFYKENVLWDSPDDKTIRPNVFLAYYLYPEMMLKEKWEKCFDKILPELYLEWGGISSVSQTDEKFIPVSDGENSNSYHNGDSWYWINNLVALVLFRVNPSKYFEYINEIMEASTKEILYMGAIGHHGEISSAEKQESLGCKAQLWSSAMYLEFFDNL